MLNLFKSNNEILGLDIGFETIKIVEIAKKRNQVQLVGAAEIPLQDRILQRDKFKNKADTANQIKEAMRKAKPNPITASKIVSALPETFVFSKTLKLPKMTEKEMSSAVPLEISQYLPIPVEDVYIDFQLLTSHPNESVCDILAVAAPKNLVDDYVEMAKLAGLELIALETKPLSVARAILKKEDKGGQIILHIGTEYSRLAVWEGNSLKMSATVTAGQNQILSDFGIAHGQKPTIEVDKLSTSKSLQDILTEVVSSIKFHNNRDYNPQPIKKLTLCGSSIIIGGIDKFFQKELGVPTEIAKIKVGKDELPPQYISAYGLALRDLNE